MRCSVMLIVLGVCMCFMACSKRHSQMGGDSALVRVDGSSTVFPLSEAISEAYQKNNAVRITLSVSGTGGGFKKLCHGDVTLIGASRPIKPIEAQQCAQNKIVPVELAVAYDGIVVVTNKQNTWATEISVDELKRLWEPAAQDKVKTWKQVRSSWPDKPIHLFGPGVDSGTYDYLTEVVVGQSHASRGDITSSEDHNVIAQGVSTDSDALGFLGLSYYMGNRDILNALRVNGITPSLETILDRSYKPLSRPIFLYVSKKSLADPGTQQFLRYYLKHAAENARLVGYVPLPADTLNQSETRLSDAILAISKQ